MVVFEDGLPRKDQYRRFNVASSTDDTDSMYQVLRRRLAHLADEEAAPAVQGERFAYRPNLLVVDGGQPQVAAAARALEDAGSHAASRSWGSRSGSRRSGSPTATSR